MRVTSEQNRMAKVHSWFESHPFRGHKCGMDGMAKRIAKRQMNVCRRREAQAVIAAELAALDEEAQAVVLSRDGEIDEDAAAEHYDRMMISEVRAALDDLLLSIADDDDYDTAHGYDDYGDF